jgi:hypothetical protein
MARPAECFDSNGAPKLGHCPNVLAGWRELTDAQLSQLFDMAAIG